MKNRRGFLKLLGIGAGAAAAGVLAIVAGTPAPAPRTIQDIEKVKPYIGPDGVPGGDYIKERPPVIPELRIEEPALTDDQYQWIVDGERLITFEPVPFQEPQFTFIGDTADETTTGTDDHSLGGYFTCTSDPV